MLKQLILATALLGLTACAVPGYEKPRHGYNERKPCARNDIIAVDRYGRLFCVKERHRSRHYLNY